MKPKDSQTKLCPLMRFQPARMSSGHVWEKRREMKISARRGMMKTSARRITPNHAARLHGNSALMRTAKVSSSALRLLRMSSHDSMS